MTTIHLCDRFGMVTTDAPTPGMVDLQYMDVGGESSMAIFQHPDCVARFPLDVPAGGVLRVAAGVKTCAWERLQGPIRFRVGAEVGGRTRWLHESTLDPRHDAADRGWRSAEVHLPEGTRAVVFETRGKRKRTAYAWCGWADPVIDLADTDERVRRHRPTPPSVLLITSDGCRPDMLGCYGGHDVATPHIDALAADGVVFDDARTNSTAAVSGYGAAMSGQWPHTYGAFSEWGMFPYDKPNLPGLAGAAGFHTVLALSQRIMSGDAVAYGRAFAEVLPCSGNPAQDGAMTTRLFLRWLDDRPAGPFFAWVSYYDTHPPARLSRHAVAEFYEGDPCDPAREHESGNVEVVRSVEALMELETALPLLRAGRVPANVYFRLRDTARAFDGERLEPDLAVLLRSLAASTRRELSDEGFAAWLGAQVEQLHDGFVSPELVAWIEGLLPHLLDVDREISTALDGVVDYRYVQAQALAAVSYLDGHVGTLVARLRDEGLYDDTTIVFMSSHGALFGENGEFGHHMTPSRAVAQIPFIVKPARTAGVAPGRVEGPFEAIDVLPTLAELLGLGPVACDGTSRLDEMRSGRNIEEHDTFTVDAHAVTVGMQRGDHRLLLTRGWATSGDETLAPGTARLYRAQGNGEALVDDPNVRSEMTARLEEWLADPRFPRAPS